MSERSDDPLDLLARLSVEHDLDRNLFVEAGAGTGKTTTLVSRIVRLVASGRLPEPRRLAAITFTEAAAAELRDRIRTALERAADPFTGLADPDERQRCRTAAGRIDEATITTLHGFAQRILAEHPLEAHLPPAFEVDEGIPAELEFLERWQGVVDDLLADPAMGDVIRLGATLRLSLDRLREIAHRLHDRWDRLEGARLDAVSSVPELSVQPVIDELRAAVALLGERSGATDGLVACLEDDVIPALRHYEAAVATDDPLEQVRVLDTVPLPKGTDKGRKPVWGDAKPIVLEHLQAAHDARLTMLVELRSHVLRALLPRVRRFTLAWAEERRRTGRLHFHDLLVLARRLLWSDAAVRTQMAERWSVLVVDEFQDTDPLQVELVFALAAADPARLPSTWEEIELGPGRVLVVGDPKQSIYGFRGADITLWNRTKARFGDGVVTLHQNFRSLDSILRWVNEVFEELIGDGDGDRQPAYTALTPSRTSLESHPDVVVLGGPADGAKAADVRLAEASDVAAVIATMRATRHPLADGSPGAPPGATRPMRHDDVAILVPTRAPIGQIERALDNADIPYRIESRSLVWGTDVIRDVLALLVAIEDPADEVAVVAALRSPALACSDADLVAWKAAGGRWDHTRPVPDGIPADHPVLAAMAVLRRWHDERHWWSVDDLVDTVVAERRLIELTMAQRRPRDHWRRLRFIVDQARAFVESGGATLAEFLRWTDLQTSEGAATVETVVPEPDDDAVRILTVHGAKGLEFPVVVLAGLSSGRPPVMTGVLWTHHGAEVMVTADGGGGLPFATPGWDDAKAAAKDFETAEALRLLYVATTRARDRLVVSLHHSPRTDCHARRLHALGALGGTWKPAEVEMPPLPFAATIDAPPARTAEERAAWRARWEAAMAVAERGWSVSPTGLARLMAGDDDGDDDRDADGLDDDSAIGEPVAVIDDDAPDGTPPAAHRGGSAVGRAVHAVLETVPLDGAAPVDPGTVAALARRFAAEEGVPEAEVAELARSALASDALADARASGRLWREVPIVVPMGDRLLEGFIDLLYERPGGDLVVVDWKTDRGRTAAEVDAALARYRLQGAGYAAALAATGRTVAEVRFVFCRSGAEPAVERTITDLDDAVTDVEALLG